VWKFPRTEWLAFSVTFATALGVFLFTLSPNVDLRFSGIFSVAAMYGGVAHPPGYPLWTVYGWLFTVFLPLSNTAWRVAISSAVAAALASGCIAFIVARGLPTCKIPRERGAFDPGVNEKAVRVCAGWVAGMLFALNGGFWRTALVAGPWPLGLLLFTIVLLILFKWSQENSQSKYFLLLIFLFALMANNSKIMAATGIGVLLFVVAFSPGLGRDLLFLSSILCFLISCLFSLFGFGGTFYRALGFSDFGLGGFTFSFFALAASLGLIIWTGGFLSEWKLMIRAAVVISVGGLPWLLLPIFSMGNPPINWGYPRSVDGFVHLISRGQYESILPAVSFERMWTLMGIYVRTLTADFGWIGLFLALVPFCCWRKYSGQSRKFLGLLAGFYLCHTTLLLWLLNPSQFPSESTRVIFSSTYIVLAILAGFGATKIALALTPLH
jgi:hypothetical protein